MEYSSLSLIHGTNKRINKVQSFNLIYEFLRINKDNLEQTRIVNSIQFARIPSQIIPITERHLIKTTWNY